MVSTEITNSERTYAQLKAVSAKLSGISFFTLVQVN